MFGDKSEFCREKKFLKKPSEEVKAKKPRLQINAGMSPTTKAKIEEERLDRKRAASREWHRQYQKKGVSWLI